MTKFLNISTDNTLGGASPSDETVSSQKAIKEYVDGATVKDNNVEWGGPNLLDNVSPADAGCVDDFGHNKAAFWGGLIDIEYTTDGTTWTSYGANDTQKWQLVTRNGFDVIVGKGTMTASGGTLTNSNVDKVRARITLHVKDSNNNSKFYSVVKKILLNVSTQGAGGTRVKVSVRTIANYIAGNDVWVDKGTYEVSGWSGWNSIPFLDTLGGYNNQTSRYGDLRLEIWSTSVNTSYSCAAMIKDIRLIGVTNWIVDNVAQDGHLYVYDRNKNVTFPNLVYGATPTEDTTTSTQLDTVGARNTKLASYLPSADQGCIIPNFDGMTAVQTIEFDTSNTSWKTIFTRTNTETAQSDLNDVLYFRITVTGTNIHQVADFVYMLGGREGYRPTVLMFNRAGTTDANYGGFRYFRFYAPKALNNGYGYGCEVIQNRNSNARHYKVEVFKTNPKVTWVQGTASSYNGTYQSGWQYTIEANAGLYICYAYGTINVADNAGYITSTLRKLVNSSQNMPAATNILANEFVFMSGNQVYPASSKTVPIETGYGLHRCMSAYSSPGNVGYDNILQKSRLSDLTNIPHATLTKGDPLYFRCTTDSSGNIYSDNYVATSMSAGYTWYYIGIAESATAIDIDTTQSIFMTLDANGNLTHINGKLISATISGLTADKALVSDANGSLDTSTVTSTELGYLAGATSNIQNQILSAGFTPKDITEIASGTGALVNTNRWLGCSESWKNFEALAIVSPSSSSGNKMTAFIISTYWLDLLLQISGNPTIWSNYGDGYLTVSDYNASSNPSTANDLYINGHAYCYLQKVYGVNRKPTP